MRLLVDPRGVVRAVYAEDVDLAALGRPAIVRAKAIKQDTPPSDLATDKEAQKVLFNQR